MEVMIRNMDLRDYEDVYQLWCTTEGMGLDDLDDTKEGIAIFLTRNPNTCFVIEEEGRIVGAVLGGHDGRRGFIYHLAVSRASRNKGYGKCLVNQVVDALRKEGIHKVALLTHTNNEVGNTFWHLQAFEKREDIYYRNKIIS